MMEAYEKFKTINHDLVNPFVEIIGNGKFSIFEVHISTYSVVAKVIGYAMRKLKDPKNNIAILIGPDKASTKAVKCAEILHKKFKGLHQCNAIGYKIQEDIWVPRDLESELDLLSVKHHIPVTIILLAKEELPAKLKSHPQRLQLNKGKSNSITNGRC